VPRLQEETARVEEYLFEGSFSKAVVGCFCNPEVSADAFENFLEPLQKLLRLSPPIASTLAQRELFSRTAQKLESKKAVVRLNLLRIIRSICDASEEQGGASLIRTYGLYQAIERLSETDPAILVKEMASELVRASELSARRSMESSRLRPGGRRTSSSGSSMTPPPPLLSSQSMPPTPQHMPLRSSAAQSGAYYDSGSGLLDSTRSSRMANGSSITPSSSLRPASRDGSSGERTSGSIWGSGPTLSKSRLPRQSNSRYTRLSLASQAKEENVTPTGAPARSRAANSGTPASSGLNPRRRRQTSSDVQGR
jgi:hypothetical protein